MRFQTRSEFRHVITTIEGPLNASSHRPEDRLFKRSLICCVTTSQLIRSCVIFPPIASGKSTRRLEESILRASKHSDSEAGSRCTASMSFRALYTSERRAQYAWRGL